MSNSNEYRQLLEQLSPEHLADLAAFINCLLIQKEAAAERPPKRERPWPLGKEYRRTASHQSQRDRVSKGVTQMQKQKPATAQAVNE